MSNTALALEQQRFLATLEIVQREGQHLLYSQQRLFGMCIDAQWVINLESRPEIAERLEAFVSRYSRMQDTIGEKLLPRWLRAQGERSTTLIDTLNRAEKLGILQSADQWIIARQLRNSLIHEYMTDPAEFAQAINLANAEVAELVGVYNALLQYAADKLKFNTDLQLQPLKRESVHQLALLDTVPRRESELP